MPSMRHRINLLVLALLTPLISVVAALSVQPQMVSAQDSSVTLPDNSTSVTQGPVACGIELTTGTNCAVDGTKGESKVLGIIKQVINVTSLLVGAICVIMIIFGGFRYMVSGGDSSGVSNAKNTILYAVVGLIIVLLAQALVRFVFSRATAA